MTQQEDETSQRKAVALVTGGTTGIGLEACMQLAATGVDVIFTSRSQAKAETAVSQIQKKAAPGVKVQFITMDLSDLASVSKACDGFLSQNKQDEPDSKTTIAHGAYLDYLILNAGSLGGTVGEPLKESADGMEEIVAINHVAGYYIAHRMLPLMESTAKSHPIVGVEPMITFVSSDLHNIHSPTGAAKSIKPIVLDEIVRFCSQQGIQGIDASVARKQPTSSDLALDYNPVWCYKYSKLLNVLTAQALHDRLSAKNSLVNCNSMEPGFIPSSDLSRQVKAKLGSLITNFLLFNLYYGPINWMTRYMIGQPVRTLREGGASEVFAATQGLPGVYYRLDKEDPPSPLVQDKTVVDGFYGSTADWLQEKGFPVTKV